MLKYAFQGGFLDECLLDFFGVVKSKHEPCTELLWFIYNACKHWQAIKFATQTIALYLLLDFCTS